MLGPKKVSQHGVRQYRNAVEITKMVGTGIEKNSILNFAQNQNNSPAPCPRLLLFLQLALDFSHNPINRIGSGLTLVVLIE